MTDYFTQGKEQAQQYLSDKVEDFHEMKDGSLAQVSGLLDAQMRAKETEQSKEFLNDPLSGKLAGERGTKLTEKMMERMGNKTEGNFDLKSAIGFRTKYFDEYINMYSKKVTQVVFLGAGLDTRSYRLHSLETKDVYEIDLSPILDMKQRELEKLDAKPLCKSHHIIRADLTSKEWVKELENNGFDKAQKTLWVCEGLSYLLTDEQNMELLRTVDAISSKKSCMLIDMIGDNFVKVDSFPYSMIKSGSNTPSSTLGAWLNEKDGWKVKVIGDLSSKGRHFGRDWNPLSSKEHGDVRVEFLYAKKSTLHKMMKKVAP